MSISDRPLSPHLQVYRPQLTSLMSIAHRVSGVALAAGAVVMVAQLVAAAESEECFLAFQRLAGSWIGYAALMGWSLALFYHLANGLRHLAWDAGIGFELSETYFSGKVALVAAIGWTAIAWGLALYMMGGR